MRSKNLLTATLLIFSICFATISFAASPNISNPDQFYSNSDVFLLEEDFFMREIHISFYSGEECGYVCIDGSMEWDGNNYSYNLTFSSDFCNTFTVSGKMQNSDLPTAKGNDIRSSAIAIYYISR